jgi:hypothetical protein
MTVLALALFAVAQFAYPPTKTVDAHDTWFGKNYPDPYRWIENLQHARVALRAVANGRGGRQAAVRRAAAEFVLSRAYLPQLTDRQLFYEVPRRRVALNARI